jgi:hypothetical protein
MKHLFLLLMALVIGQLPGRAQEIPQQPNHYQLFIKYQFFLEAPFSKKNGFPFLPHTNLQVGVRYQVQKQGDEYLTFALTSESIALPSLKLVRGTIHPGLALGLMSVKPGKQLGYSAELGYYFHKNFNQSLYLLPQLHVQTGKGNGLSFESAVGVGYIRSFSKGPIYSLQQGNYKRIPNLGRGHAMPSLSIGSNYQFN